MSVTAVPRSTGARVALNAGTNPGTGKPITKKPEAEWLCPHLVTEQTKGLFKIYILFSPYTQPQQTYPRRQDKQADATMKMSRL